MLLDDGVLIGQAGVGRTFLAQAIGLHAWACGKSVLYMNITTWLENLAPTASNHGAQTARPSPNLLRGPLRSVAHRPRLPRKLCWTR